MHEVKIISSSKTRYKPNSLKRAVDSRADLLPQEYLNKARGADQTYNQIPPGEVGPVERKLVELGDLKGIVSGNFGEVSEDTLALLAALATSRVQVAGKCVKRKKRTPEDRGGREVFGNLCPEAAPGNLDRSVPGLVPSWQTGNSGPRIFGSSWEEVAGS